MNTDSSFFISYSRDYILVSCVFHFFFFYKEKPAYLQRDILHSHWKLIAQGKEDLICFRFTYECNCLIIHIFFVGFY